MKTSELFTGAEDAFIDHQQTIRYVIRQEVARANLAVYLPNPPAMAIDLGAGNGSDALWLASLGFSTVAVEVNETMVEQMDHVQNRRLGVAELVGDDAKALEEYGESAADVVLSHGVLMYQDDPAEHLMIASRLLKSGGLLSLMTKGYDGLMAKFATEGNLQEMRLLQSTHQWQQNNLGKKVWAFGPEELGAMAGRANLKVLGWFGVRVLYDGLQEDAKSLPAAELNRLVDEEKHAAINHPERRCAPMLQIIASKQA